MTDMQPMYIITGIAMSTIIIGYVILYKLKIDTARHRKDIWNNAFRLGMQKGANLAASKAAIPGGNKEKFIAKIIDEYEKDK